MKLTLRQENLLSNLHRLEMRRKSSGRVGYFLAKDDQTGTINSLLVKGVLAREDNGRILRRGADFGS